ncbi:hypothetical protein LTS18_000807, partial [Coniosporium uncinatum]
RHDSEAELVRSSSIAGTADYERRGSVLSTASGSPFSHTSVPSASEAYAGKTFYTAHIVVPVELPRDKHLVPTFHSCLVSRTYGISLHLSVHAPGVGAPSLSLKVPVQVSSEGSVAGNEARRSSQDAAMALQEADAAFAPRSIAPPAVPQYGGSGSGGEEAPPGYEAFASGGPAGSQEVAVF